ERSVHTPSGKLPAHADPTPVEGPTETALAVVGDVSLFSLVHAWTIPSTRHEPTPKVPKKRCMLQRIAGRTRSRQHRRRVAGKSRKLSSHVLVRAFKVARPAFRSRILAVGCADTRCSCFPALRARNCTGFAAACCASLALAACSLEGLADGK